MATNVGTNDALYVLFETLKIFGRKKYTPRQKSKMKEVRKRMTESMI